MKESRERYSQESPCKGQVGRVHVHLPLHLPIAFGTMVYTAPACSFVL